ncbi:MAG TPA: nuclear transport factor 2 family protein, partial [Mycobacterium sp.]|nr:nuclear transport factor 2 family protein [Mycobacterium sp.]
HADGNTVIAFFDGEGTALDGLRYRNTYGWLMHLREDQIINMQVLFDSIPLNDLWQRVKPDPSA